VPNCHFVHISNNRFAAPIVAWDKSGWFCLLPQGLASFFEEIQVSWAKVLVASCCFLSPLQGTFEVLVTCAQAVCRVGKGGVFLGWRWLCRLPIVLCKQANALSSKIKPSKCSQYMQIEKDDNAIKGQID